MAAMDRDEPSVLYYDSDYPSEEHSIYPENFDGTTIFQGLRYDVARYKEVACRIRGPILELCCGTGRVAIPLAKCGLDVVAVDVSAAMLRRFHGNLERQTDEIASRITLHRQDVTKLALQEREFSLVIIAFNSLLLVGGFAQQKLALQRLAEHLKVGGLLALDIVNPLSLKIDGDQFLGRSSRGVMPTTAMYIRALPCMERSKPINVSDSTGGMTRLPPTVSSGEVSIRCIGGRSFASKSS